MKSWECVRMSDGNLKSWDVPTWWWGVGWVETWQSFITDITDLTDRTLGGTKDGSKGYNSHHSEYDKIYIFYSLCRLLLLWLTHRCDKIYCSPKCWLSRLLLGEGHEFIIFSAITRSPNLRKALFQQSDEEGEILFMSSINFLLFPSATWPVIREGISYQRTLTPLPTTSNNEGDNFLFSSNFHTLFMWIVNLAAKIILAWSMTHFVHALM